MSVRSFLREMFCDDTNPFRGVSHKDPLWWTIYSEDGWWQIPDTEAEKMKENLRWKMSGGPSVSSGRSNQRTFSTEYWSVAGCPPCLKKVEPIYYDGEHFHHGEPKWYAHDIYWKWPPEPARMTNG